jgi:hypothetical protein
MTIAVVVNRGGLTQGYSKMKITNDRQPFTIHYYLTKYFRHSLLHKYLYHLLKTTLIAYL